MTPSLRGDNLGVKSVKLIYIFENLLQSTPGHRLDKLSTIYRNDDQRRVYQNCKFHDPQDRGSCTRAWQYEWYT